LAIFAKYCCIDATERWYFVVFISVFIFLASIIVIVIIIIIGEIVFIPSNYQTIYNVPTIRFAVSPFCATTDKITQDKKIFLKKKKKKKPE
jgi:hypothetical protein